MSEDPRTCSWKYKPLFNSSSCDNKDDNSLVDNKEDVIEEQNQFNMVVKSFVFYPIAAELIWRKLIKNYNSIPLNHQRILENPNGNAMSFSERIKELRAAAMSNAKFLKAVVENTVSPGDMIPSLSDFSHYRLKKDIPPMTNPSSEFNAEKVQATLRQFVREWSVEGRKERDACYSLFYQELQTNLPINESTKFKYEVCCPGSGLGRLPFELCLKGYRAVANEFSYFMLICSNFLLNKTERENQYLIYPYIHQTVNIRDSRKQLASVSIPDVNPDIVSRESNFCCIAGDFLSLAHENPDYWNAVCTCFFIDTANNVIEYIEAIYHCLKPGGIWLNLGPLLYHYSDIPGEVSVELTLDQIYSALSHIGFVLLSEKKVNSRYSNSGKGVSMMDTVFKCSFFVAQKPEIA